MRHFKDHAGRDWGINVTIPLRRKVLKDTTVDLFGAADGSLIDQLKDFEKLIGVLWSILEEDALKVPLTEEQFAGGFQGDALQDASYALMEAIGDFFPSGQRATHQKLLAKAKEMQTRLTAAADLELDKMNVDDLVQKMLKTSSTKSPDMPESTPATAQSASDS